MTDMVSTGPHFQWENKQDLEDLLCTRQWWQRRRMQYKGGKKIEFKRNGCVSTTDDGKINGTYKVEWCEGLGRICVRMEDTLYFASRQYGTLKPNDFCPVDEVVLCTRDKHETDMTLCTFSETLPSDECNKVRQWCLQISKAGVEGATKDRKAVQRAFQRLPIPCDPRNDNTTFDKVLESYARVYAWGLAGQLGRPSRYHNESKAIICALRNNRDWEAAHKEAAGECDWMF